MKINVDYSSLTFVPSLSFVSVIRLRHSSSSFISDIRELIIYLLRNPDTALVNLLNYFTLSESLFISPMLSVHPSPVGSLSFLSQVPFTERETEEEEFFLSDSERLKSPPRKLKKKKRRRRRQLSFPEDSEESPCAEEREELPSTKVTRQLEKREAFYFISLSCSYSHFHAAQAIFFAVFVVRHSVFFSFFGKPSSS